MPLCCLKLWLDPGAPPPTGRFTYTTYRLPTGTLTVYSISTKAHTSWLRNSFSWHAVADICCLRQKKLFSIIFTTSPLAKSWIRAWSSFYDIPQTFNIEIFKYSLSPLKVVFLSDYECKVIISSYEILQQPSTHTHIIMHI